MRKLLIVLLVLSTLQVSAQQSKFGETPINKENKLKTHLKKTFKFATFYGAINGGNSVSDVDVY